MVLMIDNYDSFTFNIVQYLQELGLVVVTRSNDQVSLADVVKLRPSHIIISPGPCTPARAGASLAIIEHFAGQIPILGVCLGHQCIAQVFGAKVVRAQQVMHGKTSPIFHRQQRVFQHLPSPFRAARYHSLVVDEASLPAELEVLAWTLAGDGSYREIMAIQHRTLNVVGVQFHPEAILSEHGHKIFNNFFHVDTM